jgi:hypothetical protein
MASQAPSNSTPPAEGAATDAAPQPFHPMAEMSPFPDDTGMSDDDRAIFDTLFGSDGDQSSAGSSTPGASPQPSGTTTQDGSAPAGGSATAQGVEGQASGSTPAQPQQPATGATSQQSQVPDGQTPPAASTSAPAAAVTAEEKLRLQSLEATVQALQAELAAAKAGGQGAQPGQPGATQPAQPAEPADPPLGVPPQLSNPIFSEESSLEDKQAALTHLVNGIAVATERRTLAKVERLLEHRIAPLAQERQQSTAEDARKEYFEEFKEHNHPLVKPIIEMQAQQLWTEMPNLPWNKDSRAALGARVNAALQAVGWQPPALTSTAAAPTDTGIPPEQPAVATKPASMSMGATRAPAANGADSFIANTLG